MFGLTDARRGFSTGPPCNRGQISVRKLPERSKSRSDVGGLVS